MVIIRLAHKKENKYTVTFRIDIAIIYICKGKKILYRPVRGPEGSRRLRLQDFETVGT
jgi:hypothetical protein